MPKSSTLLHNSCVHVKFLSPTSALTGQIPLSQVQQEWAQIPLSQVQQDTLVQRK